MQERGGPDTGEMLQSISFEGKQAYEAREHESLFGVETIESRASYWKKRKMEAERMKIGSTHQTAVEKADYNDPREVKRSFGHGRTAENDPTSSSFTRALEVLKDIDDVFSSKTTTASDRSQPTGARSRSYTTSEISSFGSSSESFVQQDTQTYTDKAKSNGQWKTGKTSAWSQPEKNHSIGRNRRLRLLGAGLDDSRRTRHQRLEDQELQWPDSQEIQVYEEVTDDDSVSAITEFDKHGSMIVEYNEQQTLHDIPTINSRDITFDQEAGTTNPKNRAVNQENGSSATTRTIYETASPLENQVTSDVFRNRSRTSSEIASLSNHSQVTSYGPGTRPRTTSGSSSILKTLGNQVAVNGSVTRPRTASEATAQSTPSRNQAIASEPETRSRTTSGATSLSNSFGNSVACHGPPSREKKVLLNLSSPFSMSRHGTVHKRKPSPDIRCLLPENSSSGPTEEITPNLQQAIDRALKLQQWLRDDANSGPVLMFGRTRARSPAPALNESESSLDTMIGSPLYQSFGQNGALADRGLQSSTRLKPKSSFLTKAKNFLNIREGSHSAEKKMTDDEIRLYNVGASEISRSDSSTLSIQNISLPKRRSKPTPTSEPLNGKLDTSTDSGKLSSHQKPLPLSNSFVNKDTSTKAINLPHAKPTSVDAENEKLLPCLEKFKPNTHGTEMYVDVRTANLALSDLVSTMTEGQKFLPTKHSPPLNLPPVVPSSTKKYIETDIARASRSKLAAENSPDLGDSFQVLRDPELKSDGAVFDSSPCKLPPRTWTKAMTQTERQAAAQELRDEFAKLKGGSATKRFREEDKRKQKENEAAMAREKGKTAERRLWEESSEQDGNGPPKAQMKGKRTREQAVENDDMRMLLHSAELVKHQIEGLIKKRERNEAAYMESVKAQKAAEKMAEEGTLEEEFLADTRVWHGGFFGGKKK